MIGAAIVSARIREFGIQIAMLMYYLAMQSCIDFEMIARKDV
jgi:hypothetical protein